MTDRFVWESPSNIALVKYWGKQEGKIQLPANPSVSFTLSKAKTTTELIVAERVTDGPWVEVIFENKRHTAFEPKIQRFLERVQSFIPEVGHHQYQIRTSNTFPHSSGIASSASGFSALALCLSSWLKVKDIDLPLSTFERSASLLARLGSGSACRSVYPGVVLWGQSDAFPDSSDEYGIPISTEIHPVFKDYQDTVLLLETGQKAVSSSVGHDLLIGHPFARQRYEQAKTHLGELTTHLTSGDVNGFIELVETEALSLHAMMLTSRPSYILMKPETLAVIEKIKRYRQTEKVPVCFTLDAGANVHLLYPKEFINTVMDFVKNELLGYCKESQYLCDEVGDGPTQLV